MKHKIIILVLFFSQAFYLNANCQEKILTLKEAITLSIKNSSKLAASKARISAANAQVTEAQESRLPNFSISGSYLRLSSANVKLKSQAGGSGSGSGAPTISQAAYGIANLSYPIYAGGRIKYGIESAKYLEQATILDAANDEQAVILNTMNAYTNLYKAFKTVNVLKEHLESARVRDTNFYRLEENGLLTRNDRLKSELQTSNIELALMDAESNWKLANINMDLMLGLPENTLLQTDSTQFQQLSPAKTIEEYEQIALQNRRDIQALAFRKKAAGIAIKSAKTEGYPTVALTGGYIAAYVPNFVTITNAINAGVGIQYNLGSLWKSNTKLKQAKASEQEIEANEAELNNAVRMQINQAYQNYLLSQKRIEVYQRSFAQATENFRIVKNKYDNSLASVTDLLDADVALQQTRLNIEVAKADAVLAYHTLLQTAGLSDLMLNR